MRRALVVFGSCVIVPLLLISVACADNADKQEQMDFIVAALKSQLQAAGKTLEVIYDYQSVGSDGSAAGEIVPVKYLRTPARVMFLEQEGQFLVTKGSYDTAKGELRRYSLLKADNSQRGSIIGDSCYPLRSSTVMDPVLCMVEDGFLLDKIGRGVLADSKEDIDGHACYRIDVIPEDEAVRAPYTVWLDPEIGCCPRRVIIEYKEERGPTVAEFSDYIELGDGIWFPQKIKRSVDMALLRKKVPSLTSDTVELFSDVKSVRLVETDLQNPPIVEFPSGTKVTDEITGMIYTVN